MPLTGQANAETGGEPPKEDLRGIDLRGREQYWGSERVRPHKGSKRPPYIHPQLWNRAMSSKGKLEHMKKYKGQLERSCRKER